MPTIQKPTLQAALNRAFAAHPGEAFTVAELIELVTRDGYLYPPACATPDRQAGHTMTALDVMRDNGRAEVDEIHGGFYWSGVASPQHRPAPAPERAARRTLPRARPVGQGRLRLTPAPGRTPAPRVRHRAGTVRSLQNPATASMVDMTFRAAEDRVERARTWWTHAWTSRPRRERAQLRTFMILCLAVVAVLTATVVAA